MADTAQTSPSQPFALSLEDAAAHVMETDARFAVDWAVIRGERYRVFSASPPNLRAMMLNASDLHDDFIAFRQETWTYDKFLTDVAALASYLTDQGVKPGDRVALAMRNYPDLLIAFMGIVSLGGVCVFLNAWWSADELAYALDDSAPALVIADPERAGKITGWPCLLTRAEGEPFQAALAAHRGAMMPNQTIDPDDDFAVMYSSGTTGRPKGVVLTHRGAVHSIWTWLMSLTYAPLMAPEPPAPAPKQVTLIMTPFFHVTATHPNFLLSMAAGAKVVLMEKWDADQAVRLIEQHRVTRFLGVPTQSADLLEAAKRASAKLDTLSYLSGGGAKRPPSQVAPLAEAFPAATVGTGWGMTETNGSGMSLGGPEYVDHPNASGRFLPPLQEVRILSEDGEPLPNGQLGEIAVRSAMNMRCYLNKPEATAETLQNGWLKTGDLAVLGDDGIASILDRKKNIIIRGGENIACLDVEAAIHQHPAVAEAACFAVPDDRLGELVGACIHLREGETLTGEALRIFLNGRIADFKIPAHIWLQTAVLPRATTAKTDRRAIAENCLAQMEIAQ